MMMKEIARVDLPDMEGQNPKMAVVTCSDSRVTLANILEATHGVKDFHNQVFEIQNAGNLALDGEGQVAGSVDYAVKHLKVELLVLLGHSRCGACNYAFEHRNEDVEPALDKQLAWLKKLAQECESAKDLELQSIKAQLAKLREQYPDADTKFQGLYYELQSGAIYDVEAK